MKKLIYLLILLAAFFLILFMQRVRAEAPNGEPMTIQQYAEMRVKDEFGEGQWDYFYKIVYAESRWNSEAKNPRSTAYGLMQFLDSTWSGVGHVKTDNPYLQIDAGIAYISNRYQDPTKAWSWWIAHQWY